jgi:thiosulfate reductase cytochrome b subunit
MANVVVEMPKEPVDEQAEGAASSPDRTGDQEHPETAARAMAAEGEAANVRTRIYRHALPVRIGHWLNVLCLFILIMSGLQIFNAHPALYWGDRSDRDRPLLALRGARGDGGELRGMTILAGRAFDTTGVLGVSNNQVRGFPSWATLPGPRWLAMGRQWHFFFAWLFVVNGLMFVLYGFLSRHVARDLLPKRQDWRNVGKDLINHLRFRHPAGDEAKHYNVMQKLAYTGVLFGLAPLIVLTGLTMSPNMDAALPWLLDLFGGRQSARTLHFFACFAFVGFIVIHVSMVATTGLVNNLRSMITGWFVVRPEGLTDGRHTGH